MRVFGAARRLDMVRPAELYFFSPIWYSGITKVKNKIRLRRPQSISCGQCVGTRAVQLRGLGVMAGIGSLLDLGGTGFSVIPRQLREKAKRSSGFEADVQSLRGDFDVAVERVCQEQPQTRIEG